MAKKILSLKVGELSHKQFYDRYLEGRKIETQRRYIRFYNSLLRLRELPKFKYSFAIKPKLIERPKPPIEKPPHHWTHLALFECFAEGYHAPTGIYHYFNAYTRNRFVSDDVILKLHKYHYPDHVVESWEIVKSEAFYKK